MKLYDLFSDVLKEKENWDYTKHTTENYDISKLFTLPDSYNLIMELTFWDVNFHPLGIYLHSALEKIPPKRIAHTVSLYFLGISVCEKIGFDRFILPKWDNDPRRNFLHHWAGTCIFHDYGYYIENNKELYPSCKYKTIDELIPKLKIKYDLRSQLTINNKNLIDNYYKYRIEEWETIDHGIIGALVLYDALMKRNEKMEEIAKTAFMFYEKQPYGDDNKKNIINYASEIARHNMWFAEDNWIQIYKDSSLFDLIPKTDGSHKYRINESPTLYLLCLLDSLEPIKSYGQESLQKIDIDISFSNEKLIIMITSPYNDLYSNMKKCEEWLDLVVNQKNPETFEIIVQL